MHYNFNFSQFSEFRVFFFYMEVQARDLFALLKISPNYKVKRENVTIIWMKFNSRDFFLHFASL